MFTKLCRIGNDPVIRSTPSGDAVVNLSLAYSYGRKGGDGKRPTQWIEASLWGKQAESVVSFLHKGDQISVSIDDLHIETYPKKDGGEGFKLVGRIASFDFVSNKANGVGSFEVVENQAAPMRSAPSAAPASRPAPAKTNFDSFDDDVPF